MPGHRPAGRSAANKDRRANVAEKRKRVLIVCEGIATEPNYFQAIIDTHRLNGRVIDGERLDLKVDGVGRNTLSLVTYAEKQRGTGAERFDEIWRVFDKDDFGDAEFDNAIAMIDARSYLRAAWSNEAFELWYVLHFEYHNVSTAREGMVRAYYIERLHKLLKEKCGRGEKAYTKNDASMYELLGTERLNTAIANASRLLNQYDMTTPYHERKPATRVHELVQTLLKYAPAATYPHL